MKEGAPSSCSMRLFCVESCGSAELFRRFDHVLGGHAERFHDLATRGGHAEAIDAERDAVETDVAVPGRGDRGFDRDALAACLGQHLLAVLGGLTIEAREAGDAHHARAAAE